MASFNTTMM